MKVLIVGNYVNDRQISINRFVGLVEKGLRQKGHEIRRVQAQPIFGQLKSSPQGIGKWLGYIDKLIIFPVQLRQQLDWADIVCICDQALSYLTPYLKDRKYFVICHDLLAIRSALGEIPENPTSWTGKQYQAMILRGFKQAKYVVCSSEATRADVLRLTKIAPEQTEVIEDCLNQGYGPMTKEAAVALVGKFNINRDYPWLIHVGGGQWYKNRLGLLKIFKRLITFPGLENCRLILMGKPLLPNMREFVNQNNLSAQVIELGTVSDEDLRAFYCLATALIFPSFQEGFGVPVIEAQSCGCPVFTSNRLPMTVIADDAAVYFDPTEHEAAATIIAENLLAPDRLEQLRQKGFINATRFTYERMIQSYHQLLPKL